MTILVDTSALIPLIDRAALNHAKATEVYEASTASDRLTTHNYVVAEALALVQRRSGLEAVRALVDLVSAVEVLWVDQATHDAAMAALLAAGRRRVSFVDWVSFEVMRRRRISTAFAFDRDFRTQGFEVVP